MPSGIIWVIPELLRSLPHRVLDHRHYHLIGPRFLRAVPYHPSFHAAVFGTVPRGVIAWWRLAIESGTGSGDKTGLLVALWLSAIGSGGLAIGPWRADGIKKRRGVLWCAST